MKLLWRILLSRRNAVFAMAFLAGLLLASAFVPERASVERLRRKAQARAWVLDRLQPERVARSPVFLVVTAYVAAAVGASMYFRIRTRLRSRPAGSDPALERFVARRSVTVSGEERDARARLGAAIRASGLPAGHGLSGASGASGFWGSMLFHAGILVVLAAVALSARGRFSGELVLVEGFPVSLSRDAFLRASPPEAADALDGTRLAVGTVSASHAGGRQLTDVSAALEVTRGGDPERQFVSVNVPATAGDFQLTVHAYGIAPEIEAVDATGRVRAAGHAVLRVLPPGTEDSIDLGADGRLVLRFYPDHALVDGRDVTRSLDANNPVLAFRWYEADGRVAEGRVGRGQEARVGGYTVAFRSLSFWLDLLVGRDPGEPWFALGSVMGALGLAIRMLRYEQSWRASLEPAGSGTRVELTVSSRYFPARLEERATRAALELARPRS